ncbi:unnamed protein product [Phytomonas sp. Hart1]|nr:unnamed protein product [Phytomonas sp. Hart1]|eukprot:CCW69457.1 unnamed protein product [Phytomonas sp. isolate Hart1]
MKLETREHRTSENYLIQFADQLKLGDFYLGWNRVNHRRSKRKSTKAGQAWKNESSTAKKRGPVAARKARKTDSKKSVLREANKKRRPPRSRTKSSSSRLPEATVNGKTDAPAATTTKAALSAPKPQAPHAVQTVVMPKLAANPKKAKSASSLSLPPQPPLPTNPAPLMAGKRLVNPTIRLISGEKYQCRTPEDTPLYEFKSMLRRLKDPKAGETTDFNNACHSMLLVMNGVVLEGKQETRLKDFNITDDSTIYLFP